MFDFNRHAAILDNQTFLKILFTDVINFKVNVSSAITTYMLIGFSRTLVFSFLWCLCTFHCTLSVSVVATISW